MLLPSDETKRPSPLRRFFTAAFVGPNPYPVESLMGMAYTTHNVADRAYNRMMCFRNRFRF